ncbi:MAG: type IX secretion system membrane protein PorP/SprF, partial [Cytophagales bacterium]|nr:type IX secretion system membrane protein PorP/SprF [Cytophagales bacterium]
FLGQVGLHYSLRGFKVGFALPQLVSVVPELQAVDQPAQFSPFDKMNGFVLYDWQLNQRFLLQPFVFYQYNKGLPAHIQSSLVVDFDGLVHAGAAYRLHDGLRGLVGVTITDALRFSYSYGLPSPQLSAQSGGTHEVLLSYRFGKAQGSADEPVHTPRVGGGIIKQFVAEDEPEKEEEKHPESYYKDLLDMVPAFYVVVGTFVKHEEALSYAERLFLKDIESEIGYNKNGSFSGVCTRGLCARRCRARPAQSAEKQAPQKSCLVAT